jgi:hypothetical protein
MTPTMQRPAEIAHYLDRVRTGLKQFDDSTQQEILSEIEGHLSERIDELQRSGSQRPIDDALLALGDPAGLAKQFSEVSVQRTASRSFLPWVLLRSAARMMILGGRGFAAFFLGFVGYATAFAFFVAAIGKLLFPHEFGFWVGPHGVAWGALANHSGDRELAGQSFIYVSMFLAFGFGCGTTLLLRWLLRPTGLVANIMRRLR